VLSSIFYLTFSPAEKEAVDWRPSQPQLHLPILRTYLSTSSSGEQSSATAVSHGKRRAGTGYEVNNAEIMNMKTGDDAVTFFARHGNNTPLKFVYCNRSDSGDNFRPYDLDVVPRKRIAPEYFTISASGVVHIKPGVPSGFISLAEWIRESTMFNVLSSIRFFKHFLITKTFRLWRGNVRYNLYKQLRSRLSRRLFLAKKPFCAPLIEINKLMFEMQAIRLVNVKAQTYIANEFVKEQAEQRSRAGKKFEEIIEKLQMFVDKVCSDVKEHVRASGEGLIGDDPSSLTLALRPYQMKSNSLVSIKEEKAARLRQLRRATSEASMIGDFIRLVDFMAAFSPPNLHIA
jgi:dynein heavy chain